MVMNPTEFKFQPDISRSEEMGAVVGISHLGPVFGLLAVVKTEILEGHPISAKSLSLLIIDCIEPHRFQFSD